MEVLLEFLMFYIVIIRGLNLAFIIIISGIFRQFLLIILLVFFVRFIIHFVRFVNVIFFSRLLLLQLLLDRGNILCLFYFFL
mmetsp:Transcript_1356/g.201  ORF Transcript_1356/g.201 Transcript_1356/m.201 type:complete len:82 (+) Transcript_1356:545-790(+)